MRRIKLQKSMTVLAAMAMGVGTALAGTTAATAAPAAPAGGKCVTGANLVPSCGVLWGAAAGGFTTA
ncbi:endoglucanase, partial [Actinoplanes sp. NPDC049118]